MPTAPWAVGGLIDLHHDEAKLMCGKLSEAWEGEAADFTPLLADQLDSLGDALGIDLAAVSKSEVLTAGGRRIDIVARGDDGRSS